MPTTSTTAITCSFYRDNSTWVGTRDASNSDSILESPPSGYFGVGANYTPGPPSYYAIWRGLAIFDLSPLSGNANITAATLRLYGHNDYSTDDFDITVVEGPDTGGSLPQTIDYDGFQATSFGTVTTAGFAAPGWNSITINAAGIAFLNEKVQTGYAHLGILNDTDVSDTAPTTTELVTVAGRSNINTDPELVLTISIWPGYIYPAIPIFLVPGKIDLDTYGIIKQYLEGLDGDLSLATDGDGNIDLAVDAYIEWFGTGQILGYDDTNSRVTLTTLEATSAITIAADLVTADPSITTTGTAVDCTVANDALLSNTAYASIKSDIADDEIGFDAIPSATPADDEADIYMDITTGDLTLKTRDDGQAGTRTDILADFSAM